MRIKVLLILLFAAGSLRGSNSIIIMDTTVIEILDDTLSSIYYHQEDYPEPTRLVFPNLTTVLGSAYFHQNVNLVSVDLPQLNYVGDYVYFHGNEVLEYVRAPSIDTIYSYLYANGNVSLLEFDFCSLSAILPLDSEWDWSIPYYSIANNTANVDMDPFCFSQGPPENLSLANLNILENKPQNTFIGTLGSTGNYMVNSFTYYLTDGNFDNDNFIIVNDSLMSKSTFDFEVKDEYLITVGVFNQLGEKTINDFTITIEDVQNEGLQVIEILDDTLSSLYYHEENFSQPTRLVFPNLTTVLGSAYFHQNVNLVSVDLPQLNYVGDYVYFHGNEVLEYVRAPSIDTIYSYLYANGNVSLLEFDFCSLSAILPLDSEWDWSIPYYSIANNTANVDMDPFCFSQGPPENLSLANLNILENKPQNTFIGTLGSTGNYMVNSFTYYLTDGNFDNDNFIIVNDSLMSKSTFDFEVKDEYLITVGVFNQLGEKTINDFTITIEDVQNEGLQVIEILDDTLSSLYYHEENFSQPTRLVFPNLTTVLGSAYFHQNVNLVSVNLPQLNYVGDYVYFHGNQVLEYMKAPVIDTIYNYLYVYGNSKLTEFDVCSLSHIISDMEDFKSYYYIDNNPLLNLSTTCLDTSILEFMPLDTFVQSLYIHVGDFESAASNEFLHYMEIDGVEVNETDEFLIIDDGLYLTKELSYYDQNSYNINIVSYKLDDNPNSNVNEKIVTDIIVNIEGEEVISSVTNPENKENIIVYPNPTSSILTILLETQMLINVINPLGLVIEQRTLSKGMNRIDLTNYTGGIYFIQTEIGQLIKVIKL